MAFNWIEESYDNCIQQLQNSTNEQYPVTMAVLSLREDVISAALSMPHLNPGYDSQDALLSVACVDYLPEDVNAAKRTIDLLITHPRVQVSPNTIFEIARTYDLIENKQVMWHLLNHHADYITMFNTYMQTISSGLHTPPGEEAMEQMDIDFS